ncbi:MAG: dUTP diphosphatase [Treponema sp.]|nr:dUTP diphosphatase [Treponema sp.]MCR5623056.1 dUTP diphosphatase [Treponema sp.]
MYSNVKIKVLAKGGAALPVYKTAGAAGADVCAFIEKEIVLAPLERLLVPTGLFFEIPCGYEIQVRPRSGLAFKNGIAVLNSPGTIDSDYRGELKVLLANFSKENFLIHPGDRIAQIVIAPVTIACWETVDSLSDSARGDGGFGSTGVL